MTEGAGQDERRLPTEEAAPDEPSTQHEVRRPGEVAPGRDSGPEAEDREGLTRFVLGRSSRGACQVCRRQFRNPGSAASHTRASGHPTRMEYRAEYLYVRREDQDWQAEEADAGEAPW